MIVVLELEQKFSRFRVNALESISMIVEIGIEIMSIKG